MQLVLPSARPALSPILAAFLTFFAAATVLVLEIAAGRLLAPYVGVSLTTYTGIIGVILAGIALGAWAGGRAADAYGPVGLLGPTFIAGGLASMAAVPIVDVVGTLGLGNGVGAIVTLAAIGFVAPAAMLSAVAPMIVRATITDIATSGSLVGRLSAVGTVGAISGTFLTGFVLLGSLPTRAIILVAGGVVVLVGAWLAWRARQVGGSGTTDDAAEPAQTGDRAGPAILGALAGILVVSGAALAAPNPCQRESAYYCIAVVSDPARASGRTLVLDRLRHAYVDLTDPNRLEFGYARWFDAALAPMLTEAGAVHVLHVGGGGFSFPRHLVAAHPGSRHTVLELDPVVYEVARTELGFEPSDAVSVVIGDARLSIEELADNTADAVVGDAFGGLSVPWHLTTVEFLAEVDRVMRPGGTYVMNLIDGPDLAFVRAATRTLADRFEHVAVVSSPVAFSALQGGPGGGGNVVLIASHLEFDTRAIVDAAARAGDEVLLIAGNAGLTGFVADAPLLSDDFAPVDQLIGR